jgi:ATP-dependent DNA helicase RecG
MQPKNTLIHNQPPNRSATDYLDTPVDDLPKVASKRLEMLHKLDIYTVYDLVTFFPREYEDWSNILPIDSLEDGVIASFSAIVRQKPTLLRKGKLSMLRTVLSDGSGTIRAVWFNQPYLIQKFEKGQSYLFRGKIRRDGAHFDVTNPAFEPEQTTGNLQIRPVYPLTRGLRQGVIRSLIEQVLPESIPFLKEPLPTFVRKEEKLCIAGYAYDKIHRPSSQEELEIARKRLVFEELFLIQGGLRWMKMHNRTKDKALCVSLSEENQKKLEDAILRLPFELTDDQKSVYGEVLTDMTREEPMNRLIQGDVGSGKTIVAAIAMYSCALAGKQSVFMAPTSILARQHFQTLTSFLEGTGIRVALLLGTTKTAEKKQVRQMLLSGSINILVGTHAVLSEENVFAALALTITDEQHRFGVRQRSTFISPGKWTPHTLVMSATPIPRTLALILYGDLDISIIRQIPSGRIPVETYTAASQDEERIQGIVSRQIEQGRQVYYVCPVIESRETEEEEEDRDLGLLSAIDQYNHLAEDVFPSYAVGLLHGGLRPAEKEEVMDRFLEGKIQILVSTTVVEVGVDNPNASLMIIENADRFGLSQLHQLRGRIGRGSHRSVCILKSDKTDGLAWKRFQTLCSTVDGFLVAEKDLELRGPGDFFGTRQHGIPSLRIANLYRDTDVLIRVGVALDRIFTEDPYWEKPASKDLLPAILQRFGTELQHPSL